MTAERRTTPAPDRAPDGATAEELRAQRAAIVAGLEQAHADKARAESRILDWARLLRENGERMTLLDDSPGVRFRVSAEFAYRSDRAEVSAALRVSERQADAWLDLAEALRTLPATRQALREGEITQRHAAEIASAVLGLADDERARVDARGVEIARRTTPGRLARRLHVLVEALRPQQAQQRHGVALGERTTYVTPARHGLAWLQALLPAAAALAAQDRLERAADAAHDDGDGRSRAQLRADLLTDALLHGPLDVTDRPWLNAVVPSVHLTVPVLTALGRTSEPIHLEGYGPIDTDTGLRLAARAPSFQRLLTHPVSGAVLAVDRASYRVPEDLKRSLQVRDETCRFPGCGRAARRSDIDHSIDWARGGGTDSDNLAHLCRSHHMLKHHSGWSYRHLDDRGTLEWTSPAGRRYVVEPAHAMGGAPPGLAPPGLDPPGEAAADRPAASAKSQDPLDDDLLDLLESTADDDAAVAEWQDDWHRVWASWEQMRDELAELVRGIG